jgi:hypothetical protein
MPEQTGSRADADQEHDRPDREHEAAKAQQKSHGRSSIPPGWSGVRAPPSDIAADSDCNIAPRAPPDHTPATAKKHAAACAPSQALCMPPTTSSFPSKSIKIRGFLCSN